MPYMPILFIFCAISVYILSPFNNANKSFNKNSYVYMIGCVCLVGFLKFLKREKRESLDELDLPPAPPPLNGDQTGFEDLGFDEKMPELPEFPEFNEKVSEEMPKFEFSEENMPAPSGESAMPEFPSFPEEMPAAYPSIPEPSPQILQPMQEPEKPSGEEQHEFTPEPHPKMAGMLFSREKSISRGMPGAKTIYVKVDSFKATLGSINVVRSDLKKAEEALTKLESIKNAKDRSVDKLKSSLDDLQKKLIFVDKTLFKGDGN